MIVINAIHTDVNSITQTALTPTWRERGVEVICNRLRSVSESGQRLCAFHRLCQYNGLSVLNEAAQGADPPRCKRHHLHTCSGSCNTSRCVPAQPTCEYHPHPLRSDAPPEPTGDARGHLTTRVTATPPRLYRGGQPPPCLHTTPGALLLGGIPLPLLSKIGISQGSVSNCARVWFSLVWGPGLRV